MQRELWQMIVELADAVAPLGGTSSMLRVTGLSLDMPIEVDLRTGRDGQELKADLPRWRSPSGFDVPRGRLQVRFGEQEASGQ